MKREVTATAPPGQERPAPGGGGANQPDRSLWLVCRAGRILAALPIEHVVETMRALPIERFAGAPQYVRGMSIIRGAPVPVVDVGLIVGGEITRMARLVAIRAGTRTIALAVDEVLGINTIAAAALDRLSPLLHEAAAATVAALGTLDSELLVVLRTGRLVPDEVFARLEARGAAA